MSRRLDDVSRPPPLRVKLSPLARRLQIQVTEIATRDPAKGRVLEEWNRWVLNGMNERDERAKARAHSHAHRPRSA